MGATHDHGHAASPAAPPLPALPARAQQMEVLAVANGLMGSIVVSLVTGVLIVGAEQMLGPYLWTVVAACWAGFGVLQVALIGASLRE
jgi:hypothetical protein